MTVTRIIALAMTFACLIPATATASLGKTTVGDRTDQPGDSTPGTGQDWQAVATTSETVDRLSVYLLTGTTGDPELALYDANQAKVGSCTITTVDAGAWNRCSIPEMSITAGSTYWLALVRPQGQGKVVLSTSSGGSASFASDSSHLIAAPPTWVDGAGNGPETASLYADNSTPVPPPPPDGSEPAPIAGQGYHEVFRDDFKTLDRSVWDDHIWYDGAPDTSWSGFQEVDSSGTLHLRTNRNFLYTGCSADCYPINTITTQTSGKTFQYGYFEVRMKWPAGHGSWPAFWLYSYQHAIDSDQCTTQAGEVDVMEAQGSEPNVFYGTVHSNTNGCPPADDQNGNNYQPQDSDLSTGFHTYAVQWTPSTLTWYLDGVQTHSALAYPTDNQPMFLLLQEWVGGWTFNPDSTTPDTLDNQIDYVDVWQQ